MKKFLLSVLLSASLAHAQMISVSQIVEHPALNDVYRGLQDELKAQNFTNIQYEYENAQGNNAIAQQIAEKFAGVNADVLVAIGTPSAQALVNTIPNDKPVIFAAVTDPIAAKLVSDWQNHNSNVTGVSDAVPVKKNIELIREILPNVKTIGTIYNTGEANSVAAVELLKTELASANIQLIETAATRTTEVADAANSLVGKVDAIYLVQDNTVISAINAVLETGINSKIPIFTADNGSVKAGAIASVSFDYYQIGRTAGTQVAAILNGKKVHEIPVTLPENGNLVINLKAAEAMGVTLPETLINRAQEVIK